MAKKARVVKKNVLGVRGEALAFFQYVKSLVRNGTRPEDAIRLILTSDLHGEDAFRKDVRREFMCLIKVRHKELTVPRVAESKSRMAS